MRRTRNIDYPCPVSCNQSFHDQICEQEMPNVISAKLAFDPVSSLCKRTCHYCRIVDQDVDDLNAFIDHSGSFSNSMLAAEVQRNELGLNIWICSANTIDDWLDLGQRATCEKNTGWRPSGKGRRRLRAYATVAWSCDEDCDACWQCHSSRIDVGLTGFAPDPIFEVLYNFCARCRVPKDSHRLEF